jgi:hypothetical protein
MSLCTGQVVYASLAQMSVKGAANSKLEQLSVGMLDVFSSSFWTHPGYAHSVIRNCDEELSLTLNAAGVRIFQPPRSMDVVYNMFAVIDIPGLVNIATYNDPNMGPVEYEVISDRDSMEPFYTLNKTTAGDGTTIWIGADARSASLIAGVGNLGGDYLCGFGVRSDVKVTITTGNDGLVVALYRLPEGDDVTDQYSTICFTLSDTLTIPNFEGDFNAFGTAQVVGDMPYYVDAIGQYLIQDVEMTIGGARVGLLNSNYMYIHEELFGHPGRRQEDAIGKTATYEPEEQGDAGIADLQRKSMVARRLYVQLPFWWTGGKMERALKTIALQLHKIEFKVQTRQLKDCIAYASTGGQNVPAASSTVTIGGVLVGPQEGVSISTHVRMHEHIDQSTNKHLIGPVRANADGGDVAMAVRSSGAALAIKSPDDKFRAYLQIDFCGIFLNQESRDKYLKLDEKTLFSQVLGTDTDGIAMSSDNQGVQTETLNFSNGVCDIMVGVSSDKAREVGDVFGFRGTSADGTTGLRDDALESLSFDISSTPRTIANLSAEYYRVVTQFLAAKTKSELKGLYYYNVQLFDELNGTRCVNSFINASKIDDLRCRFKLNNGAYAGNKLLDDGSRVYFYAHVYNTLQIRNGMAGAMFA